MMIKPIKFPINNLRSILKKVRGKTKDLLIFIFTQLVFAQNKYVLSRVWGKELNEKDDRLMDGLFPRLSDECEPYHNEVRGREREIMKSVTGIIVKHDMHSSTTIACFLFAKGTW